MARKLQISMIFLSALFIATQASPQRNNGGGLTTCPGVAGYCSEGYVGDTCIFVCAFGRPNVPVCESNGQWTDQPRCIEHEPGVEYQISGTCLGIPGYCSLDVTGGLCEFDCLTGPDIRSFCTSDGTWEPYPICEGDIRETRDGCDPCPGPFGGARNRTLESGNQPSQPAGRPNRRNNNNNNINNGPIQGFQPVSKSSPTVIQPSRQTPFTPQQPSRPVNNNNNRRAPSFNNRGNNGNNSRRNGAQQKQNGGHNNGNRSQQNNRNRNNQQQANRFQEQPRKANFQNPQSSQGSRPNNNNNNNLGAAPGLQCPGNSLEACIDVCPSFSARIFGACVGGCARRCPTKK